ncbi:MAG: hypothetical protein KatS3mg057_1886 [Herpetosiphonaceae bacterium]|nr:MAG: hypothetical protein KatS3mg057_1886 [Herpetosiphonaceae bacterium]
MSRVSVERLQIREGMLVVGVDGSQIGKVKECRSTDFLVDRRLRRDVYVPFDAVQEITDDRVVLSIPGDAVSAMPWARPSL